MERYGAGHLTLLGGDVVYMKTYQLMLIQITAVLHSIKRRYFLSTQMFVHRLCMYEAIYGHMSVKTSYIR